MSAAPLHLLSIEDGIALVTLNRPAALNSINRALRVELLALWPELDLRKDVKGIIVTGAGDKAFCTGADLKERSTRSTEEMVFDRHYLTSQSTNALASVSKPTFCVVAPSASSPPLTRTAPAALSALSRASTSVPA